MVPFRRGPRHYPQTAPLQAAWPDITERQLLLRLPEWHATAVTGQA